jgi:hypothetical protein
LQNKTAVTVAIYVALASFCSSLSAAQETAPARTVPDAGPTTQTQSKPGDKSGEEKKVESKEQSKRVLGVLPQFGVTDRQDAPPLTPRGKFHLFARSAFDPVTIGIVGLQAGLSQADNQFPAYGQGAQGYGKRFGAAFADEVSAGFWSNFAYPVIFKEDPRYFRLGKGGFTHRFAYGIKQEFVCHTDAGGRSFAFSNILGAFTSGAISNLYYPGRTLIRTIPATATTPAIPIYETDRGLSLTVSRAAIAIAYGTIGGLFDEFWPDIRRKFSRKPKTEERQEPATTSTDR